MNDRMLDIGLDMMRGRFDDPQENNNEEADQQHPQDPPNDGAPQEPHPYSLAVELLPEATPTQHKSMDDFIKAPSRDKWLELVESMRLQREEQFAALYNTNTNINNTSNFIGGQVGVVSPNASPNMHQQLSIDIRPDPPPMEIEEDEHENDDDMRGWSMHSSTNDDEKVSTQLKSMLNNALVYNAYSRARIDDGDDSGGGESAVIIAPSSKPLVISRRMMIGIFSFGFILGSMVIVSISFYFDRTPRDELNILTVGLRGHDTINNSSEVSGIIPQNEPEQESSISKEEVDFLVQQDLSEIETFCGHCNWKQVAGVTCDKRVKWEMEEYHLTEIEAKRANIQDCEVTTETCKYTGDDC